MKVLFINHSADIDGSGIALLNLFNSLNDKKVEFVVVVPKPGQLSKLIQQTGHTVYFSKNLMPLILPNMHNKLKWIPRFLKRYLSHSKAIRDLNEIIKKEKPDLLHTNSGTTLCGSVLGKKHSIPNIWHLREYQAPHLELKPIFGMKRLEKELHHPNNHCIAITKGIFDHFTLQPNKDRMIYDGVFHKSILTTLPTPHKTDIILFVGNLTQNKGIQDLLAAFDKAQPKIPHYELWIAGKDKIGIDKLISNLNNKNKVKYLGFREDIYELMAQAKFLLWQVQTKVLDSPQQKPCLTIV